MSPNLRKYNLKTPTKMRKLELQPDEVVRSHKKKRVEKGKKTGRGKVLGVPTAVGLTCYGRNNLAKYVRFYPRPDTVNARRPVGRRLRCSFCGRDRIMHKCLACDQIFCMSPPHDLVIPGSDPPRKFSSNGPFCWHLAHGYTKWSEL